MLSQNDDGRLKITNEHAFFVSCKKHDLDKKKKTHIALHDIFNTIHSFVSETWGGVKDVLNNRGSIICQLNMSEEKKIQKTSRLFLARQWLACSGQVAQKRRRSERSMKERREETSTLVIFRFCI